MGLGDEVIVAECDISAGDYNRRGIFNSKVNRLLQHYGMITSHKGVQVRCTLRPLYRLEAEAAQVGERGLRNAASACGAWPALVSA
jgi:hypothetical protein